MGDAMWAWGDYGLEKNGVLMLTVLEARLYFIWFIVAALNWAAAMRIFNSQWLELEERHLVLISGQTIARGDILGLRHSLWKGASLEHCALAYDCADGCLSLAPPACAVAGMDRYWLTPAGLRRNEYDRQIRLLSRMMI